MRRLFPLMFAVAGCIDSAPGTTVPLSSSPASASASSPAPPPTAISPAAGGCAYSDALEPQEPAEPTQACLRERLGADGAVLERMERRVTMSAGLTTTTEESFDASGHLSQRVVRRMDGPRVVYESLETLSLAPDAMLPYTYGESATWAVQTDYDAAGRAIRKATDLAIDGTIDSEERWTWSAGVVTLHETLSKGSVTWTETFRADGQPLTRLDYGGYGQRWTYGPDGLLARHETVAAGKVTEYTEWTTEAVGMPLSRRSFRAPDELVGEETWTYDAAGRLDAREGWGRVYGFDRTHRMEYDDLGNEVHYEEHTEDASCHAYVRKTTLSADGAVLLDQLTTCDGALFEHLWTDLDAAGRPVHTERIFIGNPTWTVHETSTSAYDACGARTFHERTYGDKVTHRETLTLDALGRVVGRVLQYGLTLIEATAEYTYDTDGRVVALGEKTFTWDAQGRLTRIDLGADAAPQGKDEPPTASIVFTFDCGG